MTWTLQGLWPHVSPISPASLHPEKLDTLPSWDAARYLLFSPLHMLFSVARTPSTPSSLGQHLLSFIAQFRYTLLQEACPDCSCGPPLGSHPAMLPALYH